MTPAESPRHDESPLSSSPSPTSRPRRGGRPLWLALAAALVLLVALQAAYRWVTELRQPTGSAEWIWMPEEDNRRVAPRVFHAARDFSLEEPPAQARVLVLADEEYLLHLNGRFLGGGRYREGAALDAYRVDEVLVPGTNRLNAELRSVRGGGGFILRLEGRSGDSEDWQEILVTDRSWGLQESFSLGQLRGWEHLRPELEPYTWGRPPIGRWGSLRVGEERPVLSPLAEAGPDLRPKRIRRAPNTPATIILEFGRPVTGYLTLELAPGAGRFAKLYPLAGEAPAAPDEHGAGQGPARIPEAIPVVTGRQARRWQDTQPRTFRRVRIQGFKRIRGALLTPVPEGYPLPAPGQEGSGVFGVEGPPVASPVDRSVAYATRPRDEVDQAEP